MKVAVDAANLEEEVSIADVDVAGEVAVDAQTLRGRRPTRSLGRIGPGKLVITSVLGGDGEQIRSFEAVSSPTPGCLRDCRGR